MFFYLKKQKNHSKYFCTNEIHDYLFSATVCNLRFISSLQGIINFELNNNKN